MDEARNVVFSYPEWQANTFSVDCTGKRAVLAVQKWLAVVSLEQSSEPKALRKLAKQNKYEIKSVLWNPHLAKHELLASTCQQKLEIWNVDAERHPLLQSIKAHTRPVSDVGWCFNDPNLISSCSTDTYIHVWDIRDKKPKISFKAVAGANLVQWNRLNINYIASAHDSDIRIWDRRKPSTAFGYITAHMSRIHDLDWSYSNQNELTTCSHDGSIKFWDVSSSREPINSNKAGSQPLWRAKNYPEGNAVALLLVPTMHSGDSRVFLWGQNNVATPVHVFTGHSEAVLDLQWLNRDRLATWSKDRTLRLWAINDQLKFNLGGNSIEQSSGLENQSTDQSIDCMSLEENTETLLSPSFREKTDPSMSLPVTRSPVEGISPRSSGSPSTRSLVSLTQTESQSFINPVFQSTGGQSLAQEFAQLRLVDAIPNLEIERLEASQRSCTVKVIQGSQLVRLGITFPSHYPNRAAPSFMFDKCTTISIASQQELNRIIHEEATSYVKQNKPCLEPCLRCLVKTMDSLVKRSSPAEQTPDLDLFDFGHLADEHIPFPRTSGARFSASGLMVCFNSPSGLTTTESFKTPKSLDKMKTYRSRIHPIRGSSHWSSHAYLPSPISSRGSPVVAVARNQGRQEAGTNPENNPLTAPVTIYNTVSMLPIDPKLARVYSISGSDIREVCSQNAVAAAQHGRMDLVQAWSTAALVAEMGLDPPQDASTMPWPQHPFGRNLVKSLFSHFSQLHDVQMLAMLACVFQQHDSKSIDYQKKNQHDHHLLKSPSATSLSTPTSSSGIIYPNQSSFTSSSYKQTPSPTKKMQGQQFQPPPKREHFGLNGGQRGKHSPISSSWHEVQLDSVESQLDIEDPLLEEQTCHEKHCRLLDASMLRQCDEFYRSYSDILYSWQLLNQRAEILNFQMMPPFNPIQQTDLVNLCRHCGDLIEGPSCIKSHRFTFTCSICSLSVKGSSNFCLVCGHGGHAKHMLEWFSKYSHCPSGCGCCCLENSGWG